MQFRKCSVDGEVFEATGNQLFLKSDGSSVNALTVSSSDDFLISLVADPNMSCGGSKHLAGGTI